MDELYTALYDSISQVSLWRTIGRVTSISGGLVHASGLSEEVRIGDRIELRRKSGVPLIGEVLQIDGKSIGILPDMAPDGLAVNDRVAPLPHADFTPSERWIGRIVDPFGAPIDGNPLLRGPKALDIMSPPPPAVSRRPLGGRLNTGIAVLNTILPIVEGQRLGLFAGSGVGKSRLLGQLARNMQADVVVVALIGERGREVNDFVARVLGEEGMRRAVVIAATSDQSALTRRRCAWSAMTVAEYFRNKGKNVLLLADSITRFAEAHREIAVASGETPALRGFPPSVNPLITALCERAGPGTVDQGSITAIFSVLVAGSDMDEPIADILRGVLDGHIVLDRDIAERGRFPAINVGKSVSRSLPDAANEAENKIIANARKLLGAYEQSEVMIKAGLYAAGADPVLDSAVKVWPELDAYFSKEESGEIRDSFNRLDLLIRRALGPGEKAS
ncbi:FliI/YscN family ATPase [Phaeobacter sp. 22II1-1F12B]|uniref:FliI/YscN family ATPase n=1 Tax=Phaeobacter sp. 22II1-1F12B TaxID=1317111 RepID=UPI000B528E12|nr:FliI/YscN family ATPase [Phaeobacter sp. 22II1-1F12B]